MHWAGIQRVEAKVNVRRRHHVEYACAWEEEPIDMQSSWYETIDYTFSYAAPSSRKYAITKQLKIKTHKLKTMEYQNEHINLSF